MAATHKPVAIVIGASRGIGRQVAIDLAKAGYHVVVAAKSADPPRSSSASSPNPNSRESTITTVTAEIHALGFAATAIAVDVRSASSVDNLISSTISQLGRIDAVVYNAGAIWWSSIATTPLKRYKLMQEVNSEGLYATVQALLPHFLERNKGRIIVVSPPIYQRFTYGKGAYAMTKVAMSVLTKALAKDFERMGEAGKELAITSIWPAAAIESAATEFNIPTNDEAAALAKKKDLRKATIYSDAILAMLRAPVGVVNGLLDLDEDFLRRVEGFSDHDFEKYCVVPGSKPRRIMPRVFPDLRVDEEDDEGTRMDSVKLRSTKL